MSLPSTILASILAALMAAPLCCCAYETQSVTAAQSSCCHAAPSQGSGQQQPQDHICTCRAKDPRESVKELKVPNNLGVELAPPVMETTELAALKPVPAPTSRIGHTGIDPPTRLHLALLSRWLN